MPLREIYVRGLGVAGSYLVYAASRIPAIRVRGWDSSRVYTKPCGDAVTLRPWISRLLEELDVVVTGIKTYTIMIDGREIEHVEFPSYNWYIVNKQELVHRLREQASRQGARVSYGSTARCPEDCRAREDCICVEATGPYRHRRQTQVMAVRFLVRAQWDPQHALLDFWPSRGGLFWAFPADSRGRLVNMGAGFLGGTVEEAGREALSEARLVLGSYTVEDVKAAPISVWAPIMPATDGVARIGESAGLVMSTSGEGNRPSLESARLLIESARESSSARETVKSYVRRVQPLVQEASVSRLLLGLVARKPWILQLAGSVLGREFWIDYLSSHLTWREALGHIILGSARLIKYEY